MGKHADYFAGNKILPIPKIMKKIEPQIVSLVVTDLKTRRLVRLKKENFEDLLRTSDVLMPTEEQAAKVATNNITTKFFRLQPEYMGTRRIRVTVYNVPAFITGEVLASFLGAYGRVEEVNLLRSAAGTAYGEYMFRLRLTRKNFPCYKQR